jgi:hypothetical protein
MHDAESGPPSPRTAVALAPRDGDIAVTLDPLPSRRYLVAQVPGRTQVSMATKSDAIELARRLARLRFVDVWYTANGGYQLIEAFRPPEVP